MSLKFLALGATAVTAASLLNSVYETDGTTTLLGNSFGVPGTNLTYDYVVVGGGTAGNAIAARLALDPAGYSVAVVEPGSFYELFGNRSQVPGYDFHSALSTFVGGKIDSQTVFDLQTLPQVGYNGRDIQYVAGQTFGGSSALNYMGYFRPPSGTYDRWSDEVDDDFWAWDNVYPFYKKSCDFSPPNYSKINPAINVSYDPSAFEESGGPVHVSFGNYLGPYVLNYSRGLDSLGFEALPGLNSGKLIGYGTGAVAIDTEYGTRSSSETSFLRAATQGSSIKLYPNTIASKILFNGDKKATGVLVTPNDYFSNFNYLLSASKEVIISAGTWHSPQLLMVSGIGPSETLNKYNIDVVVDLPGVGQNEWDQPFMATAYRVNVTTATQVAAGNVDVNNQVVSEFLHSQSGPLSSIGGGQAIAFEKFPESLRSNFSQDTLSWLSSLPSDWPEAEYLPLEYGSYPEDIGPDEHYLTIGCALLATSSRGNLTISSSSMKDPPVISPNYLLNEGDSEQAVAALMRIRDIAHASGLVLEEYQPGSNYTTRAEILDWLRDNMSLIYHSASSCKMGNSTDPMAVVDSRARVRGVHGLRVVDASAFPFQPPAQPMSSVYMFAEKIAHSILTGN